ncbi:MAG: DUF2905 domain-containing protein [Thermomicrobiales bacterium]
MLDAGSLGRALMIAGAILILVGVLLAVSGRVPIVGRLPGDFTIKRGSTTIYLPFATSLLLSILLTLVARFVFRR